MGVHVHAAREDDHAGGVDGAPAIDVPDDAAVGDADVANVPVDVVRGVVDSTTGDAKHGVSVLTTSISRQDADYTPAGAIGYHAGFLATALRIRRTTSSSVGYGDFSAGRSGSGISSIRYAVPGALMPVTAVVMWTRASLLVCVTFGSSTIVGMRAPWAMHGGGSAARGAAPSTRAASRSPRISRSIVENSPGLNRG